MAKKSRGRKEQEQIEGLTSLVDHLYIDSFRNLEYEKGEMDYVGVLDDGRWDVYEVKSSWKGVKRAVEQLYTAKRYFKSRCRNTLVYVGQENYFFQVHFPTCSQTKKVSFK